MCVLGIHPKFFLVITLWIVHGLWSSTNAQTITWTGSTDNDWHKKCNWNPNTRVPNCTDNVRIPTGSTPSITKVAHCRTIDIEGNAVVNLNSGGGGRLDISSLNNGGCTGTPDDNGGCLDPCSPPPVGCGGCGPFQICCEPCPGCPGLCSLCVNEGTLCP